MHFMQSLGGADCHYTTGTSSLCSLCRTPRNLSTGTSHLSAGTIGWHRNRVENFVKICIIYANRLEIKVAISVINSDKLSRSYDDL